MSVSALRPADNQIYYGEIGRGRWEGTFTFRLTSWPIFRRARLGVKNRFLILSMATVQRLFGASRMTSRIWLEEKEKHASLGLVHNAIRLTKWHIPIYVLDETYTLDLDGHGVVVEARERFGPFPFLFRVKKRYPATIHPPGTSSTYWMPLLGADWIATYQVREDGHQLEGRTVCDFAEATETIRKLA
jgi:hypothetical protein